MGSRALWPAPGSKGTEFGGFMEPEVAMQRRKFSLEFKFEAVNLVRERGVSERAKIALEMRNKSWGSACF